MSNPELDNLIPATKEAYDVVSEFMELNSDFEQATDNYILSDEDFNSIVHTRRILGKYFRQLKALSNQQ